MSDDRMRATGNAIANRTSAVWRASWLSLSVAPTTTNARCARASARGRPGGATSRARAAGRSTNVGLVSAARSAPDTSGARATAGRRLDDPARGREHLGEGLVGVDQAPAAAAAQRGIGLRRVGGDHLGARLEPGVDRRPQVVAQVDVDERGDAGQDDGHPGREGERQADPKRDAQPRPGH